MKINSSQHQKSSGYEQSTPIPSGLVFATSNLNSLNEDSHIHQ